MFYPVLGWCPPIFEATTWRHCSKECHNSDASVSGGSHGSPARPGIEAGPWHVPRCRRRNPKGCSKSAGPRGCLHWGLAGGGQLRQTLSLPCHRCLPQRLGSSRGQCLWLAGSCGHCEHCLLFCIGGGEWSTEGCQGRTHWLRHRWRGEFVWWWTALPSPATRFDAEPFWTLSHLFGRGWWLRTRRRWCALPTGTGGLGAALTWKNLGLCRDPELQDGVGMFQERQLLLICLRWKVLLYTWKIHEDQWKSWKCDDMGKEISQIYQISIYLPIYLNSLICTGRLWNLLSARQEEAIVLGGSYSPGARYPFSLLWRRHQAFGADSRRATWHWNALGWPSGGFSFGKDCLRDAICLFSVYCLCI